MIRNNQDSTKSNNNDDSYMSLRDNEPIFNRYYQSILSKYEFGDSLKGIG